MSRKHAVSTQGPKAKDKRTGKTTRPPSATNDLIASLRGCCKGAGSSADALHQERQEKNFSERRWQK